MAKKYIGVDIGANKIGVGLVKKNKILEFKKFPTQSQLKNEKIILNIFNAIRQIKGKNRIKGIGVGIAGQVDAENGVFVQGPNFSPKFKNVKLAEILKKEFKCRVKIENDARCFTAAEAASGEGQPYRQIVGITLGTGIGGGIVIEGQLYRGKNNLAGEVGHMMLLGDKSLERSAAGSGMALLYKKYAGQTKNALEIEELAKKKNKLAIQVVNEASESLAKGLANIIHVLNPEIIVLGGGLVRMPMFIKPALKNFKKYLAYPELGKTKIVVSKLGDTANVLGATLLFGF